MRREGPQHADSRLIDRLGGPASLAAQLGYDKQAGGVQRVHNWRTRGIPAAVKWQHRELFVAAQAATVDGGATQQETCDAA